MRNVRYRMFPSVQRNQAKVLFDMELPITETDLPLLTVLRLMILLLINPAKLFLDNIKNYQVL